MIIGRQTMTGMCSENLSCLKRGIILTNLTGAFDNPHHVVPDFLTIEALKLKDVKNLLAHVELPDHVTVYSNLYAREDGEVAEGVDNDKVNQQFTGFHRFQKFCVCGSALCGPGFGSKPGPARRPGLYIISQAGPGLGLHTAGPGRAWAENNLNTTGLGRAWA